MNDSIRDPHEDREGVVVAPSFARHETFHPRYGWLKKGFDAAWRDPGVFLQPDATTRLGVGKNMVRAIRYWCSAYKVLAEQPAPDRPRLRHSSPTRFGDRLLGEGGWDPFLEDPGSLWLLHWQLLKSPCVAPAWFALFNRFRAPHFTDETLAAQLQLFCSDHAEWGEVALNSLRKDARCLLRMYASVTSGRDHLEDSIDSPFTDLGLLHVLYGTRRHYMLNIGPKRSLPPEVVAFAAAEFLREHGRTRTVTLTRLTHAPGGPGRAFLLTEPALFESIDTFAQTSSKLRLAQAAGTKQLVVDESALIDPTTLLDAYYEASASAYRGAA